MKMNLRKKKINERIEYEMSEWTIEEKLVLIKF